MDISLRIPIYPMKVSLVARISWPDQVSARHSIICAAIFPSHGEPFSLKPFNPADDRYFSEMGFGQIRAEFFFRYSRESDEHADSAIVG